jgi:hypothetical protein
MVNVHKYVELGRCRKIDDRLVLVGRTITPRTGVEF